MGLLGRICATYTADRDRGVTEEEELVQPRDEDGPEHTDEPGPEGTAGHVGVVRVGDRRTDLGIRRVILCRRRYYEQSVTMKWESLLTEELGIQVEVRIVELGDGDMGQTFNMLCGGWLVSAITGKTARVLCFSASATSYFSREGVDMTGRRSQDKM